MREIALARLDKVRPVLVPTRDPTRPAMRNVAAAPIPSTVRGLASEVPVGRANGLDHECVASLDHTTTIPAAALGRVVGYLSDQQERILANAIICAFDLDAPMK